MNSNDTDFGDFASSIATPTVGTGLVDDDQTSTAASAPQDASSPNDFVKQLQMQRDQVLLQPQHSNNDETPTAAVPMDDFSSHLKQHREELQESWVGGGGSSHNMNGDDNLLANIDLAVDDDTNDDEIHVADINTSAEGPCVSDDDVSTDEDDAAFFGDLTGTAATHENNNNNLMSPATTTLISEIDSQADYQNGDDDGLRLPTPQSIMAPSFPGKHFVLLVSNASGNLQQKANQDRTKVMLNGLPLDAIDGSNPQFKARRDELFAISGQKGVYPQLFLADGNDAAVATVFLGDYDFIEAQNEEGRLRTLLDQTAQLPRSNDGISAITSGEAVGDNEFGGFESSSDAAPSLQSTVSTPMNASTTPSLMMSPTTTTMAPNVSYNMPLGSLASTSDNNCSALPDPTTMIPTMQQQGLANGGPVPALQTMDGFGGFTGANNTTGNTQFVPSGQPVSTGSILDLYNNNTSNSPSDQQVSSATQLEQPMASTMAPINTSSQPVQPTISQTSGGSQGYNSSAQTPAPSQDDDVFGSLSVASTQSAAAVSLSMSTDQTMTLSMPEQNSSTASYNGFPSQEQTLPTVPQSSDSILGLYNNTSTSQSLASSSIPVVQPDENDGDDFGDFESVPSQPLSTGVSESTQPAQGKTDEDMFGGFSANTTTMQSSTLNGMETAVQSFQPASDPTTASIGHSHSVSADVSTDDIMSLYSTTSAQSNIISQPPVQNESSPLSAMEATNVASADFGDFGSVTTPPANQALQSQTQDTVTDTINSSEDIRVSQAVDSPLDGLAVENAEPSVEQTDLEDDFGDFAAAGATPPTENGMCPDDILGMYDGNATTPSDEQPAGSTSASLGVSGDETHPTMSSTVGLPSQATDENDFGDFGAAPTGEQSTELDSPSPGALIETKDVSPPPEGSLGASIPVTDDDEFGDFDTAPSANENTNQPMSDDFEDFDSASGGAHGTGAPEESLSAQDRGMIAASTFADAASKQDDSFGDFEGTAGEPSDDLKDEDFGDFDTATSKAPHSTQNEGDNVDAFASVVDDTSNQDKAPTATDTSFGDFGSANDASENNAAVDPTTSASIEAEVDDDDFGDFGVPSAPSATPESDVFGDSGNGDDPPTSSSQVDEDAFGDFGSADVSQPTLTQPDANALPSNPGDSTPNHGDTDDFGVFGTAPDAATTSEHVAAKDDDFGDFDTADVQCSNEKHDDSFGDFGGSPPDSMLPVDGADAPGEDDFDDFGDFGNAAGTPSDGNNDDFGNFESVAPTQGGDQGQQQSAAIDDDFGDFEAADGDGFGDFGEAEVAPFEVVIGPELEVAKTVFTKLSIKHGIDEEANDDEGELMATMQLTDYIETLPQQSMNGKESTITVSTVVKEFERERPAKDIASTVIQVDGAQGVNYDHFSYPLGGFQAPSLEAMKLERKERRRSSASTTRIPDVIPIQLPIGNAMPLDAASPRRKTRTNSGPSPLAQALNEGAGNLGLPNLTSETQADF